MVILSRCLQVCGFITLNNVIELWTYTLQCVPIENAVTLGNTPYSAILNYVRRFIVHLPPLIW